MTDGHRAAEQQLKTSISIKIRKLESCIT